MNYHVDYHRWLAGGRLTAACSDIEASSPEAALAIIRATSTSARLTDARVTIKEDS